MRGEEVLPVSRVQGLGHAFFIPLTVKTISSESLENAIGAARYPSSEASTFIKDRSLTLQVEPGRAHDLDHMKGKTGRGRYRVQHHELHNSARISDAARGTNVAHFYDAFTLECHVLSLELFSDFKHCFVDEDILLCL